MRYKTSNLSISSLRGGDGVEDGRDGRPGEVRAAVERRLDERDVVLGHPALGDERLLRHVEAEEVEAVVDRLYLPHLGEPQLQAACSSRYQPVKNEKIVMFSDFLSPLLQVTSHLRRCSSVCARMVLRSSMRVLTP